MVGEDSMPLSLPLIKSGVLTSANYMLNRYPHSHDSTQPIKVAEGKTIRYVFTYFYTEPEHDDVQIVDNDGIPGQILRFFRATRSVQISPLYNVTYLCKSGKVHEINKDNLEHEKFSLVLQIHWKL